MNEYAFDVKLAAVVRLNAGSEDEARALLERVIDCIRLTNNPIDSISSMQITECSVYMDDADGPLLFEIDGEPI